MLPSSTTVPPTARTNWSQVIGPLSGYVREPNRGLASFNRVLERLDEPVVLLLNNDVKLEPTAVGPLLEVFESHDDALFSAPLCWTFDGQTYEGHADEGTNAIRPRAGNVPCAGL